MHVVRVLPTHLVRVAAGRRINSTRVGMDLISSGWPKAVMTAARTSATDSDGYGQAVESLRVAEQDALLGRVRQFV